jgi:hypothetical protein
MNEETVELLTQFLSAMAHYSQDHARRLKALELAVKDHPEMFLKYEHYLQELRDNPKWQKSLDNTVEALDKLRQALRRE